MLMLFGSSVCYREFKFIVCSHVLHVYKFFMPFKAKVLSRPELDSVQGTGGVLSRGSGMGARSRVNMV